MMLARHPGEQKTVQRFMSAETKRHLSQHRIKYEEGTARQSEGHTRLPQEAKRGSDTDLEKVYKVKPTIKEWM